MAELSKVVIQNGASHWICSAWEADKSKELLDDTELVLSIGGDGTMLRSARAIVPHKIPLLGINLGKLGFMTQLNPDEAVAKLPGFLAGEGYIEERMMLKIDCLSHGREGDITGIPLQKSFQALNDVIVGRGHSSRAVQIKVIIDGQVLTVYSADTVIVATPTGSTAYALAAGGPILHPKSQVLLLQPVAPHLSLNNALVLPWDTAINLEVITEHHNVLLGVDGQIDVDLKSGDVIMVRRSEDFTLFLSDKPPALWYSMLMQRLRRRNDVSSY